MEQKQLEELRRIAKSEAWKANQLQSGVKCKFCERPRHCRAGMETSPAKPMGEQPSEEANRSEANQS